MRSSRAPFPPEEPPRSKSIRTLFAITLQLGRVFHQLVNLVVAGFEADRVAVRRASRAIALAILRGARDRSRDPRLRSLHDQQRRIDPLTNPRPSRPGRSSQALVAAATKAKAAAAAKAAKPAATHAVAGVAA